MQDIVEYKVAYYTQFCLSFPTISVALDKAQELYGEVNMSNDVWGLCKAISVEVDENVFMGLCAYLYSDMTIEFARSCFLHIPDVLHLGWWYGFSMPNICVLPAVCVEVRRR